MGTLVITRDTGRRLGVVGEVMVDIDRREVVALGLRDNPLTRFLPGLPRWMPLESIRQVGDVILVDSADSLAETFQPERYSRVINCQVITESGAQLGRVLGFSFDIETGELTTLVIGALGVPLLGEGVLSTWELSVGEIVSSGTDRIIVYEGAEEKLRQLGTGLLEKLGIGGGSWEQEERERFRSGAIPAENQLPAGQPIASEQRRIQAAGSRALQLEGELDYVELEERREREPLRQRRYLDEESPEQPGWGAPERELPAYRDWSGAEPRQAGREQRTPGAGAGREDGQGWGPRDRGGVDRDDPDRYADRRYEAGRDQPDRYGSDRYEPDRQGGTREAPARSGQPVPGQPGGWSPEPEPEPPSGRSGPDSGSGRRQPEPELFDRAAESRGRMPAPGSAEPADWAGQRREPAPYRDDAEPSRRSRAAAWSAAAAEGGDPEPWSATSRRPRPSDSDRQEPLDVEAEVIEDPW
jgi:sporulation protein YlmC with PRC-barrel domain